MKTSFHKFMASNANNPLKVEFGKIDDLNSELNSNSKELENLLSKFKQLRTQISILSQSYAYLAGQYSSMKNISMDLGDSKLTGDIVKSLNASNAAYKQLNDIYQKIK